MDRHQAEKGRQRGVGLQQPQHADADRDMRQRQRQRPEGGEPGEAAGSDGGRARRPPAPRAQIAIAGGRERELRPRAGTRRHRRRRQTPRSYHLQREGAEAGDGRLRHVVEALDADQHQRQQQQDRGGGEQQAAERRRRRTSSSRVSQAGMLRAAPAGRCARASAADDDRRRRRRTAMLVAVIISASAAASGALRFCSASCQTSMPVVQTFLPPSSVAET